MREPAKETGMWFEFMNTVKAKYKIMASVPSENYPPANIAAMIKQCQDAGRDDLADQIHMQWGNVLKKYPVARLNWGAAVKIGGASIKKNVFGGVEFSAWLREQEDVSPEHKKQAKSIPSISTPMKGVPAIAVPKDNETPEMWQEQALKTKEQLVEAKKGFNDIKEYIKFLEGEVKSFQTKIKTYGPGGEKATTQSGKPSKLAGRVPKWIALMKVTAEQLSETRASLQHAEGNFNSAVNDYNKAPVTTVEYEKKVQGNVENILEYVLNLKDLGKQRELLEKLNDTLDKQKIGASTMEITAAGDILLSFFEKIRAGFKSFKLWISGLSKAVNNFDLIANLRY
jgi:predicted  nucleic acid-binding Zn-ribbon protein